MKTLTAVRSLSLGLIGLVACSAVAGAMSLPALLRPTATEPATLAASPSYRYLWPTQGYFSQGFRSSFNPQHSGIDIAGPVGTPIYAAAAGVVTYAGYVTSGFNYGLGRMVEIRHADDTLTRYAHNDQLLVREGQPVVQGQVIALMGNTGNSTGPHLHFEVQRLGGGFLDPLAYLPPLAQPVRVGSRIPDPGTTSPRVAQGREPVQPAPVGRRGEPQVLPLPGQYLWPTQGREVLKGYVTAPERQHLALDIAGSLYSPVRAAAAGEVVFTGDRGDLRQAIALRHADGSVTIYGNNQSIQVRLGDRVRQGDLIAQMGQSEPQQPPHLHFEVRAADGSSVNPFLLLPR